jgi:hypothetical protein
MADREKVIKGLESCSEVDCTECKYGAEGHGHKDCVERLCADALTLVKEQESTLNRLRSTMEDMVSGNASEEVSYLLRLLNKWEQGEVYASDSV